MGCKCGRSPTGNCVGWHKLSESDYLAKKAIWEERQAATKKDLQRYLKSK